MNLDNHLWLQIEVITTTDWGVSITNTRSSSCRWKTTQTRKISLARRQLFRQNHKNLYCTYIHLYVVHIYSQFLGILKILKTVKREGKQNGVGTGKNLFLEFKFSINNHVKIILFIRTWYFTTPVMYWLLCSNVYKWILGPYH